MTTERMDLDAAIAAIADMTQDQGHTLNSTKTVAVSTTQYWEEMATCPRGVKVQLLGAGGVAIYGLWDGKNPFFTHWAPLPKRREK